MSSPAQRRKSLWLKLALVGVVLAIGGLLLWRAGNVSALMEQAKTLLEKFIGSMRDAGPWVFFGAMAVLPCLGLPMLAFTLSVGSAFGSQLGMFTVVLLALIATTINMALSYFLARHALRPLFTRLVARLGYKLPQVQEGDATSLIILLRVTPGIPFFVQNYLLGLADVPFWRYLWISCALSLPQTVGFVIFGDALLQGKGKMIFTALGVLAAAAVGTHYLRKRYSAKKAGA